MDASIRPLSPARAGLPAAAGRVLAGGLAVVALLALAKLAELRKRNRDFSNFTYAQIHAQVGDTDSAFTALERAWEVRDAGLLNIKTSPYLDPLRSDPRYTALVKMIGFPA